MINSFSIWNYGTGHFVTWHMCCYLNISFRLCCGGMEYYDKVYDRVTTKNEKPLKRINRIFHKVTTTDDPIIRTVITLSKY